MNIRVTYRFARAELTALLIVLILAALTRLYAVGYNHFLTDEADLAQLAQGIAVGAGQPTLGIQSSVGIPNSPVGAYILSVPYFFTGDPVLATAYVALLNTFGVYLLWWIARKLYTPQIALTAAVLYAASPWAIWFSTKLWAQDIHTPFVLLAFALAILGFVDGRRWAQLLCIPVFVVGLQIHFATLLLFPILLWWLWCGRRRISIPAVAIGAILGGYTLYQFWAALVNYWPPGSTGGGVVSMYISGLTRWRADPLVFMMWLTTGSGMPPFITEFSADQLSAALPALWIVWLPLIGFALIGLFNLNRNRLPTFSTPTLVWWILLPVLVFIPSGVRVYVHYYVHLIPVLCLVVSIGITVAMERLLVVRLRSAVITVLLIVLCATQLLYGYTLLGYIDRTPIPEQGTPLHYLSTVRQGVISSRVESVLVDTPNTDQSGYRIWRPLLFRAASCIRPAAIQINDLAITIAPRTPYAVLSHSPDGQYSQRGDDPRYLLTIVQDRTVSTDLIPITARFDNQITLTGYSMSGDRLLLEWDIAAVPTRDYQFFVHLLDANGDKTGQRDSNFPDRAFLCSGDRLTTAFNLPPLQNAVTLRVGMYYFDGDRFINSRMESSSGSALWVDIPLSIRL